MKTLLEQKTAQLAAVREISRTIAEAGDLDSTLDLITRRTAEVMGIQSCSIYLYDKEDETLILAASTGLNPDAIGKMTLPKGHGLTSWAAEFSQPVAVADAQTDPRFFRMVGSGESRFTSLLAMPLITRGKVIGAANVQTNAYHQFTEDEIELFGFITELAATALEKAKSVHAAVVQEIHHRVKNNLQTIAMLLRLQMAQANHLSPKDILHETINRVLSIAAVHEILAQEHHTKVGLKKLITQVSRTIAGSMTIEGQVSVEVEGDNLSLPSQYATNIALITNELLQNSLEHGLAHQQQGHIKIGLTVTEHFLCVTVTDDGRGLPPGFNLERDQGLGLELINTIATEDLGGTFTLLPGETEGTRGMVCVPRSKINH